MDMEKFVSDIKTVQVGTYKELDERVCTEKDAYSW